MLELINNEKKYPYNMQKKMKISKNNNTNYQQSINTNSITEGISDNYNEFFYGQYNHQNQLKNYIANSNKNEKIKNNNSLNNKNRIPYSENPIKQNISNNKMIQNNNKNLYISSYNDNQRAYNSFDKQTEKSGKTFKESRNNTNNNNNIPVNMQMNFNPNMGMPMQMTPQQILQYQMMMQQQNMYAMQPNNQMLYNHLMAQQFMKQRETEALNQDFQYRLNKEKELSSYRIVEDKK